MKLYRVWNEQELSIDTDCYFFSKKNAQDFINTRKYPMLWEMDEVETKDELEN